MPSLPASRPRLEEYGLVRSAKHVAPFRQDRAQAEEGKRALRIVWRTPNPTCIATPRTFLLECPPSGGKMTTPGILCCNDDYFFFLRDALPTFPVDWAGTGSPSASGSTQNARFSMAAGGD